MGIEIARFCSTIETDFICTICTDVLENPVRISGCEHMFCRVCIDSWMIESSTCPIDGRQISTRDLVAPNRTVFNFINQLRIRCEFAKQGCRYVGSLGCIDNHSKDCEFNPNKKWPCRAGCGQVMYRAEAITHRCVKMMEFEIAELTKEIDHQKKLVQEFEATNQELKKKNELVKKLESFIEMKVATILNLIEKNAGLERKNYHQEKTMENLKKEIEEMHKRNAELDIKNKTLEKLMLKCVEHRLR